MPRPPRTGPLRVEPLEGRCNPVVGAFAEAPVTAAGGAFDGVVQVSVAGGVGTGTLLASGRQVLTAAHVVDENGDHVADGDVTVRFDLPGRSIEVVVPADRVLIWPGWRGLGAGGQPLTGADDLALLDLPVLAPFGAGRFDINRRADEVGATYLGVGYGRTGTGATGAVAGTGGERRFGYNRFDTTGLVAPGDALVPPGLGLVADFDDGTPAHDALGRSLGVHDLGLGADESAVAPGDSGGPAFLYDGKEYLLAGVASSVLSGGSSDADADLGSAPTANSSFGDLVGFTRVSRYADGLDTLAADPYHLVVDLNYQPAGGDGAPDAVRIDQRGGVVDVFVNGSLYHSAPLAQLRSVTVVASADGGTLAVGGLVGPDLAVAARGFTAASDARPVVTAAPIAPAAQKTPPRPARARQLLAVGADAGGPPRVRVYDPDGGLRFDLLAFDASFSGGVRVAVGDVNGDGYPDVVAASGPGGPPLVRVFDGRTGGQVQSFLAFEESFLGGVNVASGDFDGDGRDDLVLSPDEGGGPRVRVLGGADRAVIADFFGIDDPAFRGGARVAVGDLNGDGRADLIVGAGFGGGPRVAGFDGRSLAAGPTRMFADFFVFEPTLRNGVYPAAGDLDLDQADDLIVGGGPGGGPRVLALSGRDLAASGRAVQLANFFAGNPDDRGGVRVAAKDLDGEGPADLVAGSGAASGTRVSVYAGATATAGGSPPTFRQFDAFDAFSGGVYVG